MQIFFPILVILDRYIRKLFIVDTRLKLPAHVCENNCLKYESCTLRLMLNLIPELFLKLHNL